MDIIKQQERAKYEAVWQMPEYRAKCHSLDFWHDYQALFPPYYRSVLDIGCGRGLLLPVLSRLGIDVHGVDFASNCLDPDINLSRFHRQCIWEMDLKRHFDLGLCIDLMEHIPESMVPETLRRIKNHCHIVLFKIANYPSDSLGYELHPTLKPADWWLDEIAAAGGYLIQNHILTDHKIYYFTWYT